MSENIESDIEDIFSQLCIEADSREVTHSSVETDGESQQRREVIIQGLRARLSDRYPKSQIRVGSTASGTITVSIQHP